MTGNLPTGCSALLMASATALIEGAEVAYAARLTGASV